MAARDRNNVNNRENYQLQSTLCGCTEDWKICCCGLWCPCAQCGYNKAAMDGRACHCSDCLCCPIEYFTRAQLRSAYNEGQYSSACADSCTCLFCLPCMICQDARELTRLQGRRPNDWKDELPPPPPQQMRAGAVAGAVAGAAAYAPPLGPSAHYLPVQPGPSVGSAGAYA